MTARDALHAGIILLRSHPVALPLTSFICRATGFVFGYFGLRWLMFLSGISLGDPLAVWPSFTPQIKIVAWFHFSCAFGAFFMLGQLGIVWLMEEFRQHQTVRWKNMGSFALQHVPLLLLTFTFVGAVWVISYVFFVVPALWIGARVGFSPSIMVHENVNTWRALRRSLAFSKGRQSGVALLVWLVAWLLSVLSLLAVWVPASLSGLMAVPHGFLLADALLLCCFGVVDTILAGALATIYRTATQRF